MVGAVLIGDTDLEVGACSDGDVTQVPKSICFFFLLNHFLAGDF